MLSPSHLVWDVWAAVSYTDALFYYVDKVDYGLLSSSVYVSKPSTDASCEYGGGVYRIVM